MDLRFATALANTGACNVAPTAGDLGIGAAARIIAPGAPANSVLPARMDRRDANQMPPLASHVVDAAGVTLIRDWITSLTSCM
jgi:cysteine synthase